MSGLIIHLAVRDISRVLYKMATDVPLQPNAASYEQIVALLNLLFHRLLIV